MATTWIRVLRYAWRTLARKPHLSLGAIVVLSLGISVGSVGLSLFHELTSPSLPRHDRIGQIGHAAQLHRYAVGATPAYLLDTIASHREVFARTVGVVSAPRTCETGEGGVSVGERVFAQVMPGFFDLARTQPAVGRPLTRADIGVRPDTPLVISDVFARGLAPSPGEALGRRIVCSDQSYLIVGVMPEGFVFPHAEAWTPAREDEWRTGASREIEVFVQLTHSATWGQAKAIVASIGTPTGAGQSVNQRLRLVSLAELASVRLGPALTGFVAPPMIVLLVTCLGVGGLLLSLAAGRTRETAVRLALGARSRHLILGHLAQGFLLAVPAGLLAVGLAVLELRYVRSPANPMLRVVLGGTGSDGLTYALVALVTAALPLLLAVAPLYAARRVDVLPTLQGQRQKGIGGKLSFGLRDLLVVGQIALAMILLSVFALYYTLLSGMAGIELGFDGRKVLAVTPVEGTPREDWSLLRALLLQRVRDGATAVASVVSAPPAPLHLNSTVRAVRTGSGVQARRTGVDGDFFNCLGVRIVEGRPIEAADVRAARPVVVVSRGLADTLWPHASALGKTIWIHREPGDEPGEVVGVAPDLVYPPAALMAAYRNALYMPLGPENGNAILVRTAGPTGSDLAGLMAFARPEGRAPRYRVQRYADAAAPSPGLLGGLFLIRLAGALGGVALILALLGIAGSTAETVWSSRRELGIRAALGASPSRVIWTVLRRAVAMIATGLLLGLPPVIVFNVRDPPGDVGWSFVLNPWAWMGIVAATGVVLLTSYVFARAAARVQPAQVLRDE